MTATMFQPRCADFETRVQESFARQGMMRSLGATLARMAPGEVTISMPYAAEFTQQHGFLHGGTVASVLDSACGFAGFSLMDADSAVLTVEFKINFLAPAQGERFEFVGRVVKPGRTLVLTEGRAEAMDDAGARRLIATMSCTLMAVRDRGISG
ncbi:PaaI family thioesterase [Lutimaribacter sp. EGI FJ00015]|uniref:PaaI family thioesterase n=1 Tax=Lutimaribacter degradans TaxID=2945989 RepID=A0ACC5ZTI3_9RHOB|nr:PaaI family thioesterase [Lutimaribacter sp. EGI FJ00013]MCM2561140.1 PaaI family thioesterase [Lutimaribacter sp. EGI FJ00013]MCO0611911.1 PaaI family thioesterase [Lutimaribacter sp. EGI FJ00015]MCO0634968.1 PaaI family thioesterase [Lutimaribacter sp. EGI FJ00014]